MKINTFLFLFLSSSCLFFGACGGGEDNNNPDGGDGPTTSTMSETETTAGAGLQADCRETCRKKFALSCPPPNSSEDACYEGCLALRDGLGNFCVEEYEERQACRAASDYACNSNGVSEFWVQVDYCGDKDQALTECEQTLGCKQSCERAIDLGCRSDDFDACYDECVALYEPYSPVYWESIVSCRAEANEDDLVCGEDGFLYGGGEACDDKVRIAVGGVADIFETTCEAWCFVEKQFQCGAGDADCITECEAKVADENCGEDFERYASCILEQSEVVCKDDELTIEETPFYCDDDEAYNNCLENGGEEDE